MSINAAEASDQDLLDSFITFLGKPNARLTGTCGDLRYSDGWNFGERAQAVILNALTTPLRASPMTDSTIERAAELLTAELKKTRLADVDFPALVADTLAKALAEASLLTAGGDRSTAINEEALAEILRKAHYAQQHLPIAEQWGDLPKYRQDRWRALAKAALKSLSKETA